MSSAQRSAERGAQTPTWREERRFGLLVGGAFGALALVSAMRHHSSLRIFLLGGIAVLLIAFGAALPRLLVLPYRGWMGLAHALSKVTTPILLAVVYFVVVTPIGIVRRALNGGRSPMIAPRGAETYWVRRNPEQRTSMERQF